MSLNWMIYLRLSKLNQGYDDEAIHQLINNNQVGESKITRDD